MVQAAELAYKDEVVIERKAREWGSTGCATITPGFTPPFPLQDTQAYTIAGDRLIITGFRGTEPAQIRALLSGATTLPWPGPAKTGYIHYGFGEALDSVFLSVREPLAELRGHDQNVWFTGHSLGGALAMLAGCRLYLGKPRLQEDGGLAIGPGHHAAHERRAAVGCDSRLAAGSTSKQQAGTLIVGQDEPGTGGGPGSRCHILPSSAAVPLRPGRKFGPEVCPEVAARSPCVAAQVQCGEVATSKLWKALPFRVPSRSSPR
ncbi:hypothetical protein OG361_04335 [Streptomyces sp. NBC_00090]|uniref:lipase family protein n=1 Tax=Streptomyces sp. NBC_00090 TaxID=2903619 RepID=UPI00324D21F3